MPAFGPANVVYSGLYKRRRRHYLADRYPVKTSVFKSCLLITRSSADLDIFPNAAFMQSDRYRLGKFVIAISAGLSDHANGQHTIQKLCFYMLLLYFFRYYTVPKYNLSGANAAVRIIAKIRDNFPDRFSVLKQSDAGVLCFFYCPVF